MNQEVNALRIAMQCVEGSELSSGSKAEVLSTLGSMEEERCGKKITMRVPSPIGVIQVILFHPTESVTEIHTDLVAGERLVPISVTTVDEAKEGEDVFTRLFARGDEEWVEKFAHDVSRLKPEAEVRT